jgi:methylisocitrate lyase
MSSNNNTTPGQRFRDAVASEHPLQVVGAINANHALLAKRAGFKAIYLSGGGVAAGSLGVPDLGITGRCWWTWTPVLAPRRSTSRAPSSR